MVAWPGSPMPDFVHYLPDDADTAHGGLRLTAGGRTRIAPGAPYPAPGHPDSHAFAWQRGRLLREWQVVLIAAGAGAVEDHHGVRSLGAGDVLLLVPGRWHRYRPDPAIGWEEQWLAFDGPLARRWTREGHLDPAAPSWRTALAPDLRERLAAVLTLLVDRPPAWRREAEALTAALVARIAAGQPVPADALQRAAQRLAADLQVPIDTLAAEAGLSPSRFRERFRSQHGCSPREYRQRALAARARRLLAQPGTTVAEVAAALGFSDHAHFTRGYRRACGTLPRDAKG